MRIVALLTMGCVLSLAAPGANTAAQKKTIHSKTKKSSKSTTKSTTARRATAKTAGKHATSAGNRKKSKAAVNWRSRQLAPTPDRYKEIQTALAQRGYLNGSPNGVWDASSTEALRRFQQDQNLQPTGKLNSLSLIALGLGAKRGNTLAPAVTAPPVTAPRAPALDSPPVLPQNVIPQGPAPNPALPELPPAGPPPPAGR